MRANVCLAIVVVTVGGCTNPPCSPGETRCLADSAQVCLANGEWREFANCADVAGRSGGKWQCGASTSVDGGVTCMGGGLCDATEPTPQMVRAFWSYMQSVYGSQQIDKRDAPSMKLVAEVLQLLKIEDTQTFLGRFTTTIGKRIYTPFDVGVPTPEYDLWAQIKICVHEHQHVAQYDAESIDYLARYLASGADRAGYEAEAYRTAAELDWWRYHGLDSPRGLAQHLVPYNCTPSQIESAREIIELGEDTIQRGGLVSDTSAAAIEWLQANAPALQVRG
jgi:hypothetical protein